jgi:hypothetical protein
MSQKELMTKIACIRSDQQLQEPTKRAVEIFAQATEDFIEGESKRLGPDTPAWIVMAAVASAIGIVIGGYLAAHPDPRRGREIIQRLLALTKAQADRVIEWAQKAAPSKGPQPPAAT